MCSENPGDSQRASGKLHVLEGVQGILNIHIPLPSLQVNGPKHNGLEVLLDLLKYTILCILYYVHTILCILIEVYYTMYTILCTYYTMYTY